MTKREFKEKFKRGLGSGILAIKHTEDIYKYRDIVLWACLHYTGYDWISEGTRGNYLYYAISHYEEDRDFFETRIIEKFTGQLRDSDLFDQLAKLLCMFAADGSEKAREKLYAVYRELFDFIANRKIRTGHSCYQRDNLERLCNRLVSLDGIIAFKIIINDLRKFYEINSGKDPFIFDWFYEDSKTILGKKVVRILEKNSIKHEWYVYSQKPKEKIEVSLEDVIADSKNYWLKSKKYAFVFFKDNPEEIPKFVEAVIDELDSNIKANMLKVFTWNIPFKGDVKYLIDYSENENIKLRDMAFRVLRNIKCDEARNYAIRLISENKYLDDAISVLCANYTKDDEKILSDAVRSLSFTEDYWHGVFSSVCELAGKNKHVPKDLLRYIYENTLCSFCREYLVRVMDKYKMIDYKLLQELRYDSNDDIRDFAYKKIRKAKTYKYLINLRYDNKDHFTIWFTDYYELINDYLLSKGDDIITFATEDKCRSYADKNKMALENEPCACYNLDFDSGIFSDCNEMINIWNIMSDFADSVDKIFIGSKPMNNDLYGKVFFGCNLPAVRKDGEEYIAEFDDDERAAITKIFEQGISLIKENITLFEV